MKRLLVLSFLSLLAMTPSGRAGGLSSLLEKGVHCVCPPPPECPECCDEIGGHHHCSARKSEHAHELICQLHAACCCDRVHAAKKLGHRLRADACCDPEVVCALINALQCDTCWEVRKAAAWALAFQRVRTRQAILVLYVASKADPNFLVRDAAKDALETLVLCRGECYKELFTAADALVAKLGPEYQPTKGKCVNIGEQCSALLTTIGVPVGVLPPPLMVPAPTAAPAPTVMPTPEPLPPPGPARK